MWFVSADVSTPVNQYLSLDVHDGVYTCVCPVSHVDPVYCCQLFPTSYVFMSSCVPVVEKEGTKATSSFPVCLWWRSRPHHLLCRLYHRLVRHLLIARLYRGSVGQLRNRRRLLPSGKDCFHTPALWKTRPSPHTCCLSLCHPAGGSDGRLVNPLIESTWSHSNPDGLLSSFFWSIIHL